MDRILVVDDDRDIVRLVKSYLEKAGYQILTAYDGETALRVLRAEKPQLLILDIGKREFICRGELIDLTPSEFELLRVLIQNPGFVITRDELADKALGYGSESIGRTLDSHIKNLRRKVDLPEVEESFIQTVHGIGYRLKDRNT